MLGLPNNRHNIIDEATSGDGDAPRTSIASDLPLAIVDRDGIVTHATDSLRVFLPGIVGRRLADALRMQVSRFEVLRASHAPVDAVYRNMDGEPMPAIVQIIHGAESNGDAQLLVTDCARFRRMESSRFEATPFPVMRVSEDGIVRFANAEALNFLGVARDALLCKPLTSGFVSRFVGDIEHALRACIDKNCSQRLPVVLPRRADHPDETAELIFTPDMAPDGQCMGAIVVIGWTANERARVRVRYDISNIALDPRNKVWRERLRLVLEKVRQIVDFDHAIFGIYAENLTLFRVAATFPEFSIEWPARWMSLPEGFVENWIKEGEFWLDDIGGFVSENKMFRSSEVVQGYLKAGIASSVTLVARSTQGATSALTLCSKAPRHYNEQHCATLREIGLEPVLLRCEAQIWQGRETFAEEIRSMVAKSEHLATGCNKMVDKIREWLDCDIAALFRVDRHRSQFQLVHQSVSNERFREARNTHYVQPIDAGLLGATLRKGMVLTVDSMCTDEDAQYEFLRAVPGVRSAMTVPIKLNGRVRWILCVESMVAHCFRGPDRYDLERLSTRIEEGLEQRMRHEISHFAMDESDRGIVIVGMDGVVLEVNKTAVDMLGSSVSQITMPSRLKDFAYDDHARAVLEREVSTSNRRIELKSERGERCLVFANCYDLGETYDAAFWVFTDLRRLAWSRDMRFLREIVAEVAQQVRPPLSLASSLVQQLRKIIRATALKEVDAEPPWQIRAEAACDRIALEIGKADITFERLAEAHAIRETPIRERQQIDLAQFLQSLIEAFPTRDQRHIDFEHVPEDIGVMGDEGRLSFVVRSILAYLLATRPSDDTRILAKLSAPPGGNKSDQDALIQFGFQLSESFSADKTSRQQGKQDGIQAAYDTARSDAGLAFAAIQRIVLAHGGLIETEPPDASQHRPSMRVTSFAIRFPASADPRTSKAE